MAGLLEFERFDDTLLWCNFILMDTIDAILMDGLLEFEWFDKF